jgi:outer membrane protein assembly factor BamB
LVQRSRVIGVVVSLLLLGVVLSACGSTPVAENWPGLTVTDDTIYVISGAPHRVYMLDVETGVQKGTFMPQGEYKGILYWSPVAVGGGLAFVGFAESQSRSAGLYAFDPATGQEMWHIPAQNLILPAPVYADGVVYFGDSDGLVHAVDVETKAVKPGWPFEAQEAIWASPLVDGGRVYVAAMDHYLYCLDAESGQEMWKTEMSGAMAAPPILEDGILYVGTFDGQVQALYADSGAEVEDFAFQAENWVWSRPLLVDERLFVTSLDGKLYALQPDSGEMIAPYPYDSREVADKRDSLRASPVEAGERIIVAAESGQVIAVREAQRQWIWPGGTPQASILTDPVVRGDTVYVALLNGQVQALNVETGVPGWTFTPPASE